MRRHPFAVAAAALSLVACQASALAAPGITQDPATIAQSINLTAPDLPGFSDNGLPSFPKLDKSARETARCVGAGRITAARQAFATSHSFEQDPSASAARFVLSQVSVFPTARQAARYLRVVGSPRVPKCSLPAIKASFGRDASKVRARMHRIPVTVGHAVGWRVTLLAAPAGIPREFVDLNAFARGRVLVAVSITSFPDLFPQDLEAQIMNLLVARADAAGAQ